MRQEHNLGTAAKLLFDILRRRITQHSSSLVLRGVENGCRRRRDHRPYICPRPQQLLSCRGHCPRIDRRDDKRPCFCVPIPLGLDAASDWRHCRPRLHCSTGPDRAQLRPKPVATPRIKVTLVILQKTSDLVSPEGGWHDGALGSKLGNTTGVTSPGGPSCAMATGTETAKTAAALMHRTLDRKRARKSEHQTKVILRPFDNPT